MTFNISGRYLVNLLKRGFICRIRPQITSIFKCCRFSKIYIDSQFSAGLSKLFCHFAVCGKIRVFNRVKRKSRVPARKFNNCFKRFIFNFHILRGIIFEKVIITLVYNLFNTLIIHRV